MLRLLDANTLITARDSYYAFDTVPQFSPWLRHQGEAGNIKIPLEIFEEMKLGNTENDPLYHWLKQTEIEQALLLDEEVDIALVQHVITNGYATDLTDGEVEEIGRDPFLIAYALAQPPDRCVVTVEGSKPSKKRQNRHIPDVCASLGLQCIGPFACYRALGFHTGWSG